MVWIYYISSFYLGILATIALGVDLTKLHWFWKLTLGLLALIALVLSIAYQHIEKKIDERNKMMTEFRSEQRAREITQKIDELDAKEKKGLFSDKDYLSRISLELESLNITLKNQGNLIKEQYLTSYFNEIASIPSFYNWEEWSSTEGILFQRVLDHINGHFAARGTFHSGMREALITQFKQEREKLLKAKARQYQAPAK
ncbi:MAG: hypothetical protein JNN05_02280 [Candidatus Omnitrophica bacterium]|nr:hypothetical protein [Candidatus Omnitrophota bacterium]